MELLFSSIISFTDILVSLALASKFFVNNLSRRSSWCLRTVGLDDRDYKIRQPTITFQKYEKAITRDTDHLTVLCFTCTPIQQGFGHYTAGETDCNYNYRLIIIYKKIRYSAIFLFCFVFVLQKYTKNIKRKFKGFVTDLPRSLWMRVDILEVLVCSTNICKHPTS